jgi:hypothetical protein
MHKEETHSLNIEWIKSHLHAVTLLKFKVNSVVYMKEKPVKSGGRRGQKREGLERGR